MASDLDTFVLQYKTDLTDSLGRLERLQQKMNAVEKSSASSGKGLKEFATGAAGELDRMIPGMNAIASAVKGMGAEFAVAGAAVGALAVGISSVLSLREQMNKQSNVGLVTGLSNVRQEDLMRKLSANSNGRVDRAAASEGLQKFIEMANDAYRNPTDTSKQIRLQSIGVNAFGANGSSTPPVQMLASLAAKLSGVSPDQADALARGAGLDINWARSLRTTGAAGVSNFGMSESDVKAYINGGDDVSKLNKDLQDFHNQVNQLDTSLGELLVGPFASLLKMINSGISSAGAAFAPTGTGGVGYKIVNGHRVNDQPASEPARAPTFTQGRYEIRNGHRVNLPDLPSAAQVAQTKAEEEKKRQQDEKNQKAANAAGTKQDDAAAANVAAQNKQAQLMNLFASSVGAFSNSTVSLAQAWAAWAGNIGKQNGLIGSSNAPVGGGSGSKGLRNNNPGNLEAGAFATAHGAVGSDGRFAIFPTMQAGVDAHAALLDSNYYAKGLDTPRKIIGKYAPASENNQGAYLSYLKLRGFGPDKPITDKAGFNAAQMAFESGYGSGKGIGQDRGTLNGTAAQQAVASFLGIPLQQLQQGGAGRGDAQFAVDSLEAGYINSANQSRVRLQNPTGLSQIEVSNFKAQLNQATANLAAMESVKKQILDGSNGTLDKTSQVRQVTMAAPVNIIIQGGGNMDEQKLAAEIDKRLRQHMQDAINSVTTAEKG
ncbi:hypothetical protein R69619_03330 [Paraburkholderia nemoris]|uniref:hypothetical protein n=1 Tax=Paraburkholderia nemoris TaxID=2793076 RepID=UPI001B20EA3C|nr:hypothetical protein [Paraburkholderia nemoris]CAE6760025.1 hypothetical protein R69619_03330 [Paraburkholderia nemoris]